MTVIDYRRRSMLLHWHTRDGTWTPCEEPPLNVHGVAMIRATAPNVCLYGQGGTLYLQIDAERFALSATVAPRITCRRTWMSFGFQRICTVEANSRRVLKVSFWSEQGGNFFRWLAAKSSDSDWRVERGRRWTEGVLPEAIRAD